MICEVNVWVGETNVYKCVGQVCGEVWNRCGLWCGTSVKWGKIYDRNCKTDVGENMQVYMEQVCGKCGRGTWIRICDEIRESCVRKIRTCM